MAAPDTTRPMGPYEPGPPLPNPIPGLPPEGRGFAVGPPGTPPAPAKKKKKGKSLAGQVGGAIEGAAGAVEGIPGALWNHFTNPGIALQNAMSNNPGHDPKPGTPEAAAMAAAGAPPGVFDIGGVTPDLIAKMLVQSEQPNVEMLNTLGGLLSGKGAGKGSPLAALATLLGPLAGSKTGKGVGGSIAGLGTAATQAAPSKALQQFLQWLPTASSPGGGGLIGSSDIGSTGTNDPVNQSTAALFPKTPGQ